MMDSVDLGDENVEPAGARQRVAPPIQPPLNGQEITRKQTQRSVSIEQAAKPSFDITVGDPHKVGDLTSSHIVYQVRTKVFKLARMYIDTLVTTTDTEKLDLLKSIQATRICCQPTVSGFLVAV